MSLAGDMVVMGLAEASWVNIYLLPRDSSHQTKVRCKEGDCGGGGTPGAWALVWQGGPEPMEAEDPGLQSFLLLMLCHDPWT